MVVRNLFIGKKSALIMKKDLKCTFTCYNLISYCISIRLNMGYLKKHKRGSLGFLFRKVDGILSIGGNLFNRICSV